MDPALLAESAPLQDISRRCAGFSGSDLVELCSQAASVPVHTYLAQHRARTATGLRDAATPADVSPNATPTGSGRGTTSRGRRRGATATGVSEDVPAAVMSPLSQAHFEAALRGFKPAMQHAQASRDTSMQCCSRATCLAVQLLVQSLILTSVNDMPMMACTGYVV